MSAPINGPEMDAAVCEALGIPGRARYYAEASGPEHAGAGWYWADWRGEVERAIADYARRMPNGWTAGSVVREMTVYPPVSEDVGAAWGVVDRMLATGAFGVNVNVNHESGAACAVDFGEHVEAETVPLAICRAALLWAKPAVPAEPEAAPAPRAPEGTTDDAGGSAGRSEP